LIVVVVAVDNCDASVLKGTRSVGSTARALQRRVPTIAWARVIYAAVTGGTCQVVAHTGRVGRRPGPSNCVARIGVVWEVDVEICVGHL
jgi:hypothetical protein